MSSEYDPNIKIKREPCVESTLRPEVASTIYANDYADKKLEFVNIKAELDFDTTETNIKKEAEYQNQTSTDSSRDSTCTEIKLEPEDNLVKSENTQQYQEDELSHLVPARKQPNSSQDIENETASTDDTEKSNSCPVCQKTFANQGNVNRHLLIHARVKHECDVCSKKFLNQDQLNRHKSWHNRASSHDCLECGKRFKTPSKLKQHTRTHIKEKSYFCEHCHKAFSTEATLAKHKARSRCKKPLSLPLSCTVCFKTFEKEFLLKSHLRRHETDRPYACDLCGMSFKHKSTIVRHILMTDE